MNRFRLARPRLFVAPAPALPPLLRMTNAVLAPGSGLTGVSWARGLNSGDAAGDVRGLVPTLDLSRLLWIDDVLDGPDRAIVSQDP